jgi:PHP family Zn ribbon phosphoesterase
VEGFNDRLLIGATQIALIEIVAEVHRLGGLSIASHVDRPSFSLLSQLGFIPAELKVDALEISRHANKDDIDRRMQRIGAFPIVTFSDAHFIEDIGRPYTTFLLETPKVGEIRKALVQEAARKVEIH